MGVFKCITEILDRAQARVVEATQQAAQWERASSRLHALEARKADLRVDLEHAIVELGRVTFRRWKNNGAGHDEELAVICRQINGMNDAYQLILAELADFDAYASTGSDTSMSQPALPPLPSGMYQWTGGPIPFADNSGRESGAHGIWEMPEPSDIAAAPMKHCRECFDMVASSCQFCPSCGMRV
jgi:hypothetical protein